VPEVEAVSVLAARDVGQVWLRLQYKFAFEAGTAMGYEALPLRATTCSMPEVRQNRFM
jgi:hypothetical protein